MRSTYRPENSHTKLSLWHHNFAMKFIHVKKWSYFTFEKPGNCFTNNGLLFNYIFSRSLILFVVVSLCFFGFF